MILIYFSLVNFLLLLCLTEGAAPSSTTNDVIHAFIGPKKITHRFVFSAKYDRNDNQEKSNVNDHDDDDEENETAYRNRSLAWTKRYRTLLRYDQARRSVIRLGLRSKEEWDEYVSNGKPSHGAYLPSQPEKMYASDWTSWEDFLGIMRTYDDARDMVQNVLRLRSREEYEMFIRMDPARAEGLRLPWRPEIVYGKGKGWRGDDYFFGDGEDLTFQ
eukprot:CAMPEP_0171402378 /NCGR_PEP_ID=MMETSP0880-20121228/8513_1 /TAXON_ID=67004 /ORGANISM="Thalassiosira weissflogii, Strain CCMP1336" /LENGTH=215 /DNA_ID=CAMNT_0011917037 /DNA_START=75 /DNA_END=722 /DNA_ORIENTATION=-